MTTVKSTSKILLQVLLFSLFIFSSEAVMAQRPLATFKTTIKSSAGTLLDSVKVTVIDNTAIVAEGVTARDGKFKFASFYNKSLIVEFEKPGYLKQTIKVSTYISPRIIPEDMSMTLTVEMLPVPATNPTAHFDKATEEIILDTTQGKFIFNPEYKAKIKDEWEAFRKSLSEGTQASN
ncbi:MAG: hypothetical protein ACKOXB_02100 [Flavobacteriales bacterium]